MSPAVTQRIANARVNFNGQIRVVEDRGDTAVVLVIPAGWDAMAETDDDVAAEDDWACMRRPFLMLIDPAYAEAKDGARQ